MESTVDMLRLTLFSGSFSSLSSIIVLALLLRVLWTQFLYPELFTPLKQIPTPPGRSLLKGNASPSGMSQAAHFRQLSATVPNNGLIRYYQKGNVERVLVASHKALGEVLVSNAASFVKPNSVRQRLLFVTGNGILLAEGEEHKTQRKNLMPAFSFRHIKDLYPVFWSKARELTGRVEKSVRKSQEAGSNVIVVRFWATRTTLDIIGLAGMDHDFDALQNPDNSLNQKYKQIRPNPSRFEMLLGFVLTIFWSNAATLVSKIPSERRNKAIAASKYIRNLCQDIIQEKQQKLKTNSAMNDIDIISVALKSGVFTDSNLVDQMMTFLAAGHGTTSHALEWAVYALSKHDDIQTRLRKEIREKLPSITDQESTISAADIDGLPYLHAFCSEVLRFYPPVPTTVREALHDTTVAGYRIPKGTLLTISPGMTNHDKELWGPDADVFDPERWMREGCANTGGVQNNYGFLTFLHGPRSCIGSTFAKAELACLVAAFVGRFRMKLEEPDKKLQLTKSGVGSAPVDGVRAVIEVLDGW